MPPLLTLTLTLILSLTLTLAKALVGQPEGPQRMNVLRLICYEKLLAIGTIKPLLDCFAPGAPQMEVLTLTLTLTPTASWDPNPHPNPRP